MFKKFMQDKEADEMFITGQAGTGKTTMLADLMQYCADNYIKYRVCAFTHKACGILVAKLPAKSPVQTLHSYLKKRPMVNTQAMNHRHIESNMIMGQSDEIDLLVIDEYSMVGEQDLMDVRALGIKVLYIGDSNQLPPVGSAQAVVPWGDYQMQLTHVYRQSGDNPLLGTLQQLVSFIEGAKITPLESHQTFIRGQDIAEWYVNDRMKDNFDGVLLAYTNERVQQLNAEIMGREVPEIGDKVQSPTTKELYTFNGWVEFPSWIELPFGEPLALGSKYKILEFLIQQGYLFAALINEEGDEVVHACVFGHSRFKRHNDTLKKAAAASNAAIGEDAAKWAKANAEKPKAQTRSKAWRSYLSFNQSVVCLDFAHAMTIHKSQGSTYNSVYLDLNDLAKAAEFSYNTYLKLMYVAMSRASGFVVTN